MCHVSYKQNVDAKNRDYKAALGIDHCDRFNISGHDFKVINQLSKTNKYE